MWIIGRSRTDDRLNADSQHVQAGSQSSFGAGNLNICISIHVHLEWQNLSSQPQAGGTWQKGMITLFVDELTINLCKFEFVRVTCHHESWRTPNLIIKHAADRLIHFDSCCRLTAKPTLQPPNVNGFGHRLTKASLENLTLNSFKLAASSSSSLSVYCGLSSVCDVLSQHYTLIWI